MVCFSTDLSSATNEAPLTDELSTLRKWLTLLDVILYPPPVVFFSALHWSGHLKLAVNPHAVCLFLQES